MLRRALRSLGGLLLAVAGEERERSFAPRSARGESPQAFARRAVQLAQNQWPQNQLIAGGIEVLGLRDIMRGAATDVTVDPRMLADLTEREILRVLDGEDMFMRKDEETFLLCFASPDRAEAKRKLQAISANIRNALSKHVSEEHVQVTHDVVEIDVEDIEDDALIGSITESLKRVRQEAEETSRLWRQHLIQNTSIVYQPIWLSHKQVIAIHRAGVDDETGRFAMRRLMSLSSADALRGTLFDLDSIILVRATTALHNLISEGGRTQLIVPLYFDSLTSRRRRTQYKELCENIPPAYRRFLLFEIHGIPRGTPDGHISEIVNMLNSYAHGVLLEVDLKYSKMPEAMGLAGVVTRLSPASGEMADVVRLVERFVTCARSVRLKTFLYGVDTDALADGVFSVGADYLQGSGIAKCTKDLRPHYHWKLRMAS
ncbi:MAG: hypothetical protein KGO02_02035 [Alphaproteobacteria bacterium]|nr:hypothetical protein [Alphaproteobacteria bacterium]